MAKKQADGFQRQLKAGKYEKAEETEEWREWSKGSYCGKRSEGTNVRDLKQTQPGPEEHHPKQENPAGLAKLRTQPTSRCLSSCSWRRERIM